MSEWASEWMTEWASEWVTNWVNGWVNEWMNEWYSDWVTEWLSEWMNEWVSEWITEWVCEWLSEWLSEWVSDRHWCRSHTRCDKYIFTNYQLYFLIYQICHWLTLQTKTCNDWICFWQQNAKFCNWAIIWISM